MILILLKSTMSLDIFNFLLIFFIRVYQQYLFYNCPILPLKSPRIIIIFFISFIHNVLGLILQKILGDKSIKSDKITRCFGHKILHFVLLSFFWSVYCIYVIFVAIKTMSIHLIYNISFNSFKVYLFYVHSMQQFAMFS